MSLDANLQDLVLRCLERFESEGEPAIEAFCREHPEYAPQIRRRVMRLLEMGLLETSHGDPGSFPERLGEFRLLRRLGGGGMGVVYLAEQESLGRQVALKLIRPEHLYFPGAKERFRREVEAVARMQHPGIVPVHAVGEDAGVPYFAMEHVDGLSLEELLRELRGRSPLELGGEQLERVLAGRSRRDSPAAVPHLRLGQSWMEICFRIAKQAAEALDHAHQRGVVHRDIKPSNVMLTASGRVVLLDFGLASTQGTSRLTRSGALVGSLPYMAPEQVRGDVQAIDRRTDVYALGVTLYELLTLRLPFAAGDAERTRRAVLEGRPSPVRAVNPTVTWDAETVCLTAMECEPSRRYQTADQLARDLENVLELRPIDARRTGVALRTWRWSQRHPATSMTALLLVLMAALAIGLQEQSRRRVGAKNLELADRNSALVAALAHAERNFTHAQDAVSFMLARVGDTALQHVPQMEVVRRELLEEALRFYDVLLAEKPGDARMLAERARTCRARGSVLALLGRHDQAQQAYRDYVVAARELAATADPDADPGAGAWSVEAAIGARQLGRVLDLGSRPREARTEYEAAEHALAELMSARPGDVDLRHELALVRHDLASIAFRLGDRAAAHGWHEQAVADADALHALAPADPAHRALLSLVLHDRAVFLLREHDADAAVAPLRRALGLASELVRDVPRFEGYRVQLAQIARDLGGVLMDRGESGEAVEAAARGAALFRTLAAEYPNAPAHRLGLASTLVTLGAISGSRGDLDAAGSQLEEAVRLGESLVAATPGAVDVLATLGHALNNLAAVALDRGDLDLAEPLVQRAIGALEQALAVNPGDPIVRWRLGCAHFNHAEQLVKQGDWESAADALDEVAELTANDARLYRLMAGVLARCAAAARGDAGLAEEERTERGRDLDARALAMLEHALAYGFRDTASLHTAPDLESLRGMREWDALPTRPGRGAGADTMR